MKEVAKVFSVAIGVFLAGCATTPKYQVSEGIPTATIVSNIYANSSVNSSTTISLKKQSSTEQLFSLSGMNQYPKSAQKIEANKPLELQYYQSDNTEFCKILVKATLEENKHYILVGGFGFEKGLISFLPGQGNCKFGVVDAETKKLISSQIN